MFPQQNRVLRIQLIVCHR